MTEPDQPDWGEAKIDWETYQQKHKEHIHALGVIVSVFNSLENAMFLLFRHFLDIDFEPGHKVFAQLSNHARIDLTRDAITQSAYTDETKELANYFIDAFETLCEVRNFIAHSTTIANETVPGHLTVGKGSKRNPDDWSYADLSVSTFQRVAQEIRAYLIFGIRLYSWLDAQKTGGVITFHGGRVVERPTLPKKPPAPTELKNIQRDPPQSPKPRHQSSGE